MERKEISRREWRIRIWTPIILGGIVWSIANTLIQNYLQGNPTTTGIIITGITVGGILIGWGFGLAYSRYFKIKEIDK